MHFIRHSRSSNVCSQPLRQHQLPFINPLLRFTLETAALLNSLSTFDA
jgi:hypothetical protein